MTSDLLADLEARGLVQDTTDRAALAERLAAGPITLYHGIDPTADSLHTGNLIGLFVLRRFQEAGHRPLALAGGATGMVGDPSGRSEERNRCSTRTRSMPTLPPSSARCGSILEIGGASGATLVDNRTWTEKLSLIDFLRDDVGKHATVNTMMARESVKIRMQGDDGISFTEFSYMLLQANDFRVLADTEGCELQIGGSDQWGNILAGVDLIRRTRQRSVHALSWPLITAADGTKLGKTTGARIWLDPARTSAYQFFQHWMQVEDAQVGEFLAKFTFLPMAEVEALVEAHAEAPERREAQRRLALEVTTVVHGSRACRGAQEASAVLFGGSIDAITTDGLTALLGRGRGHPGKCRPARRPRHRRRAAPQWAGLVAGPTHGAWWPRVAPCSAERPPHGRGRDTWQCRRPAAGVRAVLLRRGKRDYASPRPDVTVLT